LSAIAGPRRRRKNASTDSSGTRERRRKGSVRPPKSRSRRYGDRRRERADEGRAWSEPLGPSRKRFLADG
jgi:hypothetical protein